MLLFIKIGYFLWKLFMSRVKSTELGTPGIMHIYYNQKIFLVLLKVRFSELY